MALLQELLERSRGQLKSGTGHRGIGNDLSLCGLVQEKVIIFAHTGFQSVLGMVLIVR